MKNILITAYLAFWFYFIGRHFAELFKAIAMFSIHGDVELVMYGVFLFFVGLLALTPVFLMVMTNG